MENIATKGKNHPGGPKEYRKVMKLNKGDTITVGYDSKEALNLAGKLAK